MESDAAPRSTTTSTARIQRRRARERKGGRSPSSVRNSLHALRMATPVFLLLLLAMAFRGSDGAWCVCRSDATDTALQKTLDYACGHGADCAAVLPTGPCYSPTSVQAHCSYAANSYFQRNSQASGATCDFGGTANLTDTDPSSGTCKYPATPSEAGTSGNSTGAGAGTGTSPPGSTSNPATTPSMGGTFTTPVGASGPTPSFVSAATAAAFAGRHVLLLAVVSVLAFLVR
ncbi:hypothetical protein SEVIR_5G332000v4 [Setaria viridis]|uniref:X8 domain-containing protein n=1 Tax=Setaria viridis TaxID=4556 RepID=A0A4U6UKP4_SETVI|nr:PLASMODESMATA CALLOSE-BINDING PROTEIN 3-like [Setaria viridis]TKW16931.1 hypothetical protein SEVIR_5G332000v2 [Setaria viridis]